MKSIKLSILLCAFLALAVAITACAPEPSETGLALPEDTPATPAPSAAEAFSAAPVGAPALSAVSGGEDAEDPDEPVEPGEEDVTHVLNFEPTPSPTPVPTPTPEPLPTFTVTAMEEEIGYVQGGEVNVRSGPGKEFPVLYMVERNTILAVTGESGDWYRVDQEEGEGYISKTLAALGPIPTPSPTPYPYKTTRLSHKKAYVNAGTVNFRKGPHESYDIIAECERYTTVTVTGHSENYYRVKYDGTVGYMSKEFVQIGLCPKDYPSCGKYSSADVLLLAQIAYRESSHNTDGYKAVASVVLNRIKSSHYPNTVEKVVFQGNGAQFSPADNPDKLRLTKPSDACIQAVCEVIENGPIFPSDVMYFRTASMGTDWGSVRVYYGTYGGNCYFS